MLTLKTRLKPYTNDGFNYKDRTISRANKIWVRQDKERHDSVLEQLKLKIKGLIREGIICKNLKLIDKGIQLAASNQDIISDDLSLDVQSAKMFSR